MMRSPGNSNYTNTLVASHTASGAETALTTVTGTFPGNSTAKPVKVRVSGSVSGYVQVQLTANKYLNIACNPNAAFVEEIIPPGTFSSPVTGLPIGFQCDAAGTIRVIVFGQ